MKEAEVVFIFIFYSFFLVVVFFFKLTVPLCHAVVSQPAAGHGGIFVGFIQGVSI